MTTLKNIQLALLAERLNMARLSWDLADNPRSSDEARRAAKSAHEALVRASSAVADAIKSMS